MTEVLLSKMIIRYRYNIRTMTGGLTLLAGIALVELFMLLVLSQLTQKYWEKVLWPGSLRLLMVLSLVWIIEKGTKKYFGRISETITFSIRWGAFLFFWCFLPPFPSIFPNLAMVLFKLFFVFTAIFFAIISIWGMYAIRSKQGTSALVLDHSGMWVDRFGLIPWSNIAAIGASVESQPPCLFIKVKDPEALRAQATRMGKLFLMVTSKFGKLVYSPGYHISATGLDTPNDVIIAFARQYMQSDTQN